MYSIITNVASTSGSCGNIHILYGRFCDNAPGTSLLQLYISLVLPHLDYALAI